MDKSKLLQIIQDKTKLTAGVDFEVVTKSVFNQKYYIIRYLTDKGKRCAAKVTKILVEDIYPLLYKLSQESREFIHVGNDYSTIPDEESDKIDKLLS